MSYTLGQAAKATGMSKSSVLRAIKSNKLSAAKDEATGAWMIEPPELHRIYPPAFGNRPAQGAGEARLEELRDGWNRERAQLEQVIDDLRSRLNAADEERRTTLRQLTALLTDQSQQVPKRKGWLGWLRV
jgi:hypothetical protein